MEVYTDIKDVPLDEYTIPDGIDKEDQDKQSLIDLLSCQGRQANGIDREAVRKSYIIPFRRAIERGTRGRDVIGAKRAIWKANDLKVPKGASQLFGSIAVRELEKFQHRVGLKADGILGRNTLKKLAPYFDAYAFLLYVGYPPSSSATKQKQNLFVAYMMWGYNEKNLIGYSEYRPMIYMNNLKELPISEDCSSFYTKGAKFAGFKDPNGYSPQYPGWGYTGTLAAHGKHVLSPSVAQPGDAFLYGLAPNYYHVAGYVGSGRVVSLGSPPGPLLLEWDYRNDLGAIRRYV